MKSLRLRDGGGLVQMLGIDLDSATQEINAAVHNAANSRKLLHLIITGPAFGINFASYHDHRDETTTGHWSNTVVHAVSKASPFHSVVSVGDPVVAIDGKPSHATYSPSMYIYTCACACRCFDCEFGFRPRVAESVTHGRTSNRGLAAHAVLVGECCCSRAG